MKRLIVNRGKVHKTGVICNLETIFNPGITAVALDVDVVYGRS